MTTQRTTQRITLGILGLALLSNLLLLVPLPFSQLMLVIQSLAVLMLTAFLPGWLLVEILLPAHKQTTPTHERILYTIGTGYGTMVLGMLWLSYLPGGLATWQTFAFFDVLTVVLLGIAYLTSQSTPESSQSEPTQSEPIQPSRWLITGILVLLLVGGFFRFTNLGYAEFQGDEARTGLRAAAIIQGYEDVLMLHKKGPTEILVPTAMYSLTEHLNETMSRLPFAIANLAGLFALFLLGWRLLGPLVGWSAAMILALDGYFIGFSRIVQYQSVVFLTSVLAVLILYRLYQKPENVARLLTLAAFLLMTGLMSHYEAALAMIPAAYLLGMILWRHQRERLNVIRATVIATVIGGGLLATFYIPFITHPHFTATYTYLADRRIGGTGFPYNNLADFFLRSTVYNTTYQVVLMIALTVVALIIAYWRGFGRRWGVRVGSIILVFMIMTLFNPEWMLVGDVESPTDFIVLPFVLALLPVWLMPKLCTEERTLWLWFGFIMILAFFFTLKPRTHIYTFFMPWSLLAASALVAGWQVLKQRIGASTAVTLGGVTAIVLIAVFGSYAYWYFVYNQVEILRTWDENRPVGYWTIYDVPDNKAIFGFPLANGWKVVGALYDAGVLVGDYETNEKEAWVPAWYTRGQHRCGRTADWYFQIENLESWGEGDQLRMEHNLRHGFTKWAVVEVNGIRRMVIYKRTGESSEEPYLAPEDDLPRYVLDEYELTFDQLAQAGFPLTYPSIDAKIGNPLHINFDNKIWLEGYDIDYPQPLSAGDNIRLTLYWRAQEPIWDSYKVFNQSFYDNGTMVAQLDGFPVCETRETWRWDPGELITDVYDIAVKDDAPDGLYPFFTGLYLPETWERLQVLDAMGNFVDERVHLTDIRVGVE